MTASRHAIDDTAMIRPHIRLCHRLLAEALVAGYGSVELTSPQGEMPVARAQVDDALKPLMAFPPAVFEMMIAYLKEMAGLPPEQQDASGTIQVRFAGSDASIGLRTRRSGQGAEELVLHFPAAPIPKIV